MSIFIHDCIECQQNKHINQYKHFQKIPDFSTTEDKWLQKDL